MYYINYYMSFILSVLLTILSISFLMFGTLVQAAAFGFFALVTFGVSRFFEKALNVEMARRLALDAAEEEDVMLTQAMEVEPKPTTLDGQSD